MRRYQLNALAVAVLLSTGVNAQVAIVNAESIALQQKNSDAQLHKSLSANFNTPQIFQEAQTQTREWHGEVTTAKVLTVLMEFNDIPNNSMKPDDLPSKHYLEHYSINHYQNLIYGENGYTGPKGVMLPTVRDYVLDQSGGSFDINGEVFGWYTSRYDHTVYKRDTRVLVKEAVHHVLADERFNLSDYDSNNDGQIDHLSIIHSSLGGESEPRALRPDPHSPYKQFIHSHRSTVNQVVTNQNVDKSARIGSYFIQPIDTPMGLYAHEFSHSLGLADEYDQTYTTDEYGIAGETVASYSLMSSGSWGGAIRGSKPTGYSPYAKLFLQNKYGGNWVQSSEINSIDLDSEGTVVPFSAAGIKGVHNDLVKVNLPQMTKQLYQPIHKQAFDLTSYSTVAFAVSLKGSQVPSLSLDLNAEQSINSSYGFTLNVEVPGTHISDNIKPSNSEDFMMSANNTFIRSTNKQWQKAHYDLSAYKDHDTVFISLSNYAIAGDSTYVAADNIEIFDGSKLIKAVNSNETEHVYFWNNAALSDGSIQYTPYYLLEWRQHVGFDESLKTEGMEEGLLVWYVDPSYMTDFFDISSTDNQVAAHPGEGWIGIVDADRNPIFEYQSEYTSTGQWVADKSIIPQRSGEQIRDAAFNTLPQRGSMGEVKRMDLANGGYLETILRDEFTSPNPRFADWDDYTNYVRPSTGKKLPKLGLIFEVLNQSEDGSTANVRISKSW
ncbi:immune inhibitor A [Pseudoalteromonas luteoviolacea]|uniref:immune inhibitor A domain-containing protein n=1 Tax=Pseudoalteromonas luteoviolacea TaxID=43657 RepID=UPI001F216F70|nr:immune inhibitor A domain-containing protein [Pseudoalteromonas luteoviolacea]MCF6439250.1 immune inhibitor A [Pseudoalteromonas luteoviolacea]